MSQENVEVVSRSFEVFSRGGPDAVMSGGFWQPDIVWDFSLSGIPGLGVYQGYAEVKAFFEEDWFGAFPFEEWEVQLGKVIDLGDQVIALGRQRGRGASSGAVAELEFTQIYTMRDGAVAKVDTYLDREKALEAVGLRE
jgi:ketosteroid isomerase-like protein